MKIEWNSAAKSQYNMLYSSLQKEVDGLLTTIETFPRSGRDCGSYRSIAFNNYELQYTESGNTITVLDICYKR